MEMTTSDILKPATATTSGRSTGPIPAVLKSAGPSTGPIPEVSTPNGPMTEVPSTRDECNQCISNQCRGDDCAFCCECNPMFCKRW